LVLGAWPSNTTASRQGSKPPFPSAKHEAPSTKHCLYHRCQFSPSHLLAFGCVNLPLCYGTALTNDSRARAMNKSPK
jgi:hypothetical protein